MSTTKSIAELLKPIAQAYYEWLKGRTVARMKAAIESGEKYIQVNEQDGQFHDLEPKDKKKLLLKYRKRFFKYN